MAPITRSPNKQSNLNVNVSKNGCKKKRLIKNNSPITSTPRPGLRCRIQKPTVSPILPNTTNNRLLDSGYVDKKGEFDEGPSNSIVEETPSPGTSGNQVAGNNSALRLNRARYPQSNNDVEHNFSSGSYDIQSYNNAANSYSTLPSMRQKLRINGNNQSTAASNSTLRSIRRSPRHHGNPSLQLLWDRDYFLRKRQSDQRGNPFYLCCGGPPLISQWDSDYVPLKRFNDQQNLSKKEASISDESEYWVAVYGYDSEDINSVIAVFRRYGRISNFFIADDQMSLHIRFESKFAAQQALEQDGLILNDFKIWAFSHTSVEHIEGSVDAVDHLFGTCEILTRTPRRHAIASEYYYLTPDAAELSFLDWLFKWQVEVPIIPFILFFLIFAFFFCMF